MKKNYKKILFGMLFLGQQDLFGISFSIWRSGGEGSSESGDRLEGQTLDKSSGNTEIKPGHDVGEGSNNDNVLAADAMTGGNKTIPSVDDNQGDSSYPVEETDVRDEVYPPEEGLDNQDASFGSCVGQEGIRHVTFPFEQPEEPQRSTKRRVEELPSDDGASLPPGRRLLYPVAHSNSQKDEFSMVKYNAESKSNLGVPLVVNTQAPGYSMPNAPINNDSKETLIPPVNNFNYEEDNPKMKGQKPTDNLDIESVNPQPSQEPGVPMNNPEEKLNIPVNSDNAPTNNPKRAQGSPLPVSPKNKADSEQQEEVKNGGWNLLKNGLGACFGLKYSLDEILSFRQDNSLHWESLNSLFAIGGNINENVFFSFGALGVLHWKDSAKFSKFGDPSKSLLWGFGIGASIFFEVFENILLVLTGGWIFYSSDSFVLSMSLRYKYDFSDSFFVDGGVGGSFHHGRL